MKDVFGDELNIGDNIRVKSPFNKIWFPANIVEKHGLIGITYKHDKKSWYPIDDFITCEDIKKTYVIFINEMAHRKPKDELIDIKEQINKILDG